MLSHQVRNHAPSPTWTTYLSEIRAEPLLSAAEECILSDAIAKGDPDARSRMILANLRLVVSIAILYGGRGLALDDLVAEGNLGLIQATKNYDPRYGTRFSTYASYWIKQAIRHALINTTALIRLPCHMVVLLTKWKRIARAFTLEFGLEPTLEQIAATLGLTSSQKFAVGKAQRSQQILRERGDESKGSWSIDELACECEPIDAKLRSSDEQANLSRRLDGLDARERKILSLRFGLGGGEPMTLKQVGREIGLTREWVRRIQIRAIRRLGENNIPPKPVGLELRRGNHFEPKRRSTTREFRLRTAKVNSDA